MSQLARPGIAANQALQRTGVERGGAYIVSMVGCQWRFCLPAAEHGSLSGGRD
jgi:hypothetical protein